MDRIIILLLAILISLCLYYLNTKTLIKNIENYNNYNKFTNNNFHKY